MLGAVVVHPEQREVFPLAPEPIVKGDGATKNDCERTAKRLLGDVRREHPHLKLIVVEDGLASNGPHIKLLKHLDMRGGEADHKALFEWVEATERVNPGAVKSHEHTDEHGVHSTRRRSTTTSNWRWTRARCAVCSSACSRSSSVGRGWEGFTCLDGRLH